MKIFYLIKRILAFIIDVLIYYINGLIVYIALDNNSLPLGMDRITWSFIILSFIVIGMGIFYPIKGQSIGQMVFKLKYHYFRKDHNKVKLAVIRSFIMLLFIVPVFAPPIYLFYFILIFIIFSIKPFIKQKRLFIDLLTGIEVIEYDKNKKDT